LVTALGGHKTPAGNKSIAAIGAGQKNNHQQCISKLWFRRTEFFYVEFPLHGLLKIFLFLFLHGSMILGFAII